jgi:hypothetical protein
MMFIARCLPLDLIFYSVKTVVVLGTQSSNAYDGTKGGRTQVLLGIMGFTPEFQVKIFKWFWEKLCIKCNLALFLLLCLAEGTRSEGIPLRMAP